MNHSALLIEDDISSLFIMAELLEKEGFSIHKATSYQAAMAIVANNYDVIVCDLHLPDGHGLDIIAAIKRLPQHKHTPVMCVTASNHEKDIKRAFELGACDYIVKPIWFTVFTEKVAFLVSAKKNAEQLELASTHDSLSNLLNRRGFFPLANQLWNHAFRNQISMVAFFVDIDNFKCINDEYGHDFGDSCIINIAEILQLTVRRDTDLIARYGGDEYVVLLPSTNASTALEIANSICTAAKRLSTSANSDTTGISISVTIGIASIIPRVDTPLSHLLNLADKALLDAKSRNMKGSAHIMCDNYEQQRAAN